MTMPLNPKPTNLTDVSIKPMLAIVTIKGREWRKEQEIERLPKSITKTVEFLISSSDESDGTATTSSSS
jgi:hypothetical protein